MTGLPEISRANLEAIDDTLDSWLTTVQTVTDRHVPQSNYKQLPCPQPSMRTQLIRITFQVLKQHAKRAGWTQDTYRHFTLLRLELHDSRQEESRLFWAKTLADLTACYPDPREFWGDSKKIDRTNDNDRLT